MPEVWDGGAPSPTDPLLASGGESEVAVIVIGAYWFPTTDSRDNVGFLGSLPLSPQTKSKPVTPARGGVGCRPTQVRPIKRSPSRPQLHPGIPVQFLESIVQVKGSLRTPRPSTSKRTAALVP